MTRGRGGEGRSTRATTRGHDAATATALLDAAESLLAAGGPGAVTVRAVAEAHGTTTRAGVEDRRPAPTSRA